MVRAGRCRGRGWRNRRGGVEFFKLNLTYLLLCPDSRGMSPVGANTAESKLQLAKNNVSRPIIKAVLALPRQIMRSVALPNLQGWYTQAHHHVSGIAFGKVEREKKREKRERERFCLAECSWADGRIRNPLIRLALLVERSTFEKKVRNDHHSQPRIARHYRNILQKCPIQEGCPPHFASWTHFIVFSSFGHLTLVGLFVRTPPDG